MQIKQKILCAMKNITPKSVRKARWRIIEFLEGVYYNISYAIKNIRYTTRGIFEEVYSQKKWGGKSSEFYSGLGSHAEMYVEPYVEKMIEYLKTYGKNKPRLVDLGCGDFNVGKNFIDYASKYTCVDIVPAVIEKHINSGYPSNVQFTCVDILTQELPEGDICFLRQVLQHLSNKQITRILSRLKQYKIVFITEQYPIDDSQIVPNKNIFTGHGVRSSRKSAVYLDEPPFNIPKQNIELILEAPRKDVQASKYCYLLRTYKIDTKNIF